jgi:alanyl-tRNA synthetase
MEAVAGMKALDYYRHIEGAVQSVAEKLKAAPAEVPDRVAKLLERQRQLEQELRDAKLKIAQGGSGPAAAPEAQKVDGVNLVMKVSEGLNTNELRTLADRLRNNAKTSVVFVASVTDDEGREKVAFVVSVSDDLKPRGLDAGKLAKSIAGQLGGSGGGRPDFAQGGGQGKSNLDAVLKKFPDLLKA